MKTSVQPIIVVSAALLCFGHWSSGAVQRRAVTDAAVAERAAIDPLLDAQPAAAAAVAAVIDDREKRQLSFVQGKLLNLLKPLPVVDVTKEEEKYGNDGDKFNRFGRSFIGGVEKVSSMLTSALSFPVDTAKKLSRSATETLNNLGGRLIGLQR